MPWLRLHMTAIGGGAEPCCAVLCCAAVCGVQLLKLMDQFPDVVFLKVDFDSNKAMCKTLGVKVCMQHVGISSHASSIL